MAFVGYRDILGSSYHEMVKMMWARSKIFRDVTTPLWLSKVNETFKKEAYDFQPDIVLVLKGDALLPKYIENIRKSTGAKIALWYPDDPRFFRSLVSHIAPRYDVVFTYSKNARMLYESISVSNVFRIPFGCDPFVHKGKLIQKGLLKRALFIGTFTPKRYLFIRKLISLGCPVDIVGPKWVFAPKKLVVEPPLIGPEYVAKMQSYSVVLNIHNHISYGPNMRTFEVTGSGGVLLTDRAEDVTDFFYEGKEILVYDSPEHAAQQIKEFIEAPEILYEMASKAQGRCYSHNTYDKRAKLILSLI